MIVTTVTSTSFDSTYLAEDKHVISVDDKLSTWKMYPPIDTVILSSSLGKPVLKIVTSVPPAVEPISGETVLMTFNRANERLTSSLCQPPIFDKDRHFLQNNYCGVISSVNCAENSRTTNSLDSAHVLTKADLKLTSVDINPLAFDLYSVKGCALSQGYLIMLGVAHFHKPKICLLVSQAEGVGVVQKPRSPMVPGQVPKGPGFLIINNLNRF